RQDFASLRHWLQTCIFHFFFFSSRRRHTRWPRDWSSDVCSSDLESNGWPRTRPFQASGNPSGQRRKGFARGSRPLPSRWPPRPQDRKSTRLNSSHVAISYAVFCLKKKKKLR